MSRFSRWRASRLWLRDAGKAMGLLSGAVDGASADPASLSLAAWLALTHERDEAKAEQLARAALEAGGDTRFAVAALAEILRKRDDHDEAIELLRDARGRWPEKRWYELSLADALVEAGRIDEAEAILETGAIGELRRHCVKRLSRLALERGDKQRALRYFGELIDLAPDYLVYASDYVTLGNLQLEAGDRESARETWRRGAEIYARNPELRALQAEHFGAAEPLAEAKVAAVSEETIGARRIPVRTPMISVRTGLLPLLDEVTAPLREPGDIVVLAESAAAAGQGRLIPLELINPGPVASFLSRYVGKAGPLHSPEGMQGAILVSGRPRVLLGAVASVIGKALRRSGWFYRVTGPQAAMIDDVAAALPPHDHHLILGPADPTGLAAQLAEAFGCEAAVVDANHKTGAWAVGYSSGVDKEWLEAALADNPAGNEDEQTPVVIVRRT